MDHSLQEAIIDEIDRRMAAQEALFAYLDEKDED